MSERGERLRAVFLKARDLRGAARSKHLDEECGEDADFRRDVESLLQSFSETSTFLETPLVDVALPLGQFVSPPAFEQPGDCIGQFALVRILGQGGFGTVWLAERRAPFQQTVAIKILKPGMDSEAILSRFLLERRALATLDHPNIAKALDGGMSERGRPYFVMEYVDGESITAFADRHRLGLVQRLELFIPVCDAVQHAHAKRIIHRDVKPSNILVMGHHGAPVVKVIDFGVAKTIATDDQAHTRLTEAGHTPGTLDYMSPEQVGGRNTDVDTRTDVYSLGVVLYQLLTGHLPLSTGELPIAALGDAQRLIREVVPAKPSTRCIQAKTRASTDEPSLDKRDWGRQLRGDLDWIVMRCLEKDRDRRYATPTELSTELRRVLNNEPVAAGPPSVAYRTRKFAQRNRLLVGAVAVVMLTMTVGVATTTFQWRKARAQAVKAQAALELLEGMFKGIDPDIAEGMDTQLLSRLLAAGSVQMESKLSTQPEAVAQLRSVLVQAYWALGDTDAAAAQAEAVLDVCRTKRGSNAPETASALIDLGSLRAAQGRLDEAEELLRASYSSQAGRHGSAGCQSAPSICSLATFLVRCRGREGRQEAVSLLEPLVANLRRGGGEQEEQLGWALNELALAYDWLGRPNDAMVCSVEAVAITSRRLGATARDTMTMRSVLAQIYEHNGRVDDAIRELRHVVSDQEARLGDHDDRTAMSRHHLGTALLATGLEPDLIEAERLIMSAADTLAATKDPNRREGVQIALQRLATVQKSKNRLTDAEITCRRGLDMSKDQPCCAGTRAFTRDLAELLGAAGKAEEGERLLLDRFHSVEKERGPDDSLTVEAASMLATWYEGQGRRDAALEWKQRSAPASR